jgi:hypothetical protein
VYLDYRTSKYELDDLRTVLNNGISKKLSKGLNAVSIQPFRAVEPRNSKSSEIIQLNDIILGAIGYHKNGYHLLSGSSKAKIELSNYIAQKAGLTGLSDNTRYGQSRFAIWNFQFRQ